MRNLVCAAFCCVMLFNGCAERETHETITEPVNSSAPSREPEASTIVREPPSPSPTAAVIYSTPIPTPPEGSTPGIPRILPEPIVSNETRDIEHFESDYVYLTDGTKTFPWTLVREGDTFLGWKAGEVRAVFDQYEDMSIAYWLIHVPFSGEATVRVRLEYWDESDAPFDGVYAFVNEESYALLPSEVMRPKEMMFQMGGPEIDKLIADTFGGVWGVIEDCRIVIQDYSLILSQFRKPDFTGLRAAFVTNPLLIVIFSG